MVEVIRDEYHPWPKWDINGRHTVMEGVSSSGASILQCTEHQEEEWCEDISGVMDLGLDGQVPFATSKVWVPVRPRSEARPVTAVVVNLARPDEHGVAEMWIDFLVDKIPFKLTYQQNRNPNSTTCGVNVGLRLPGEGRKAMRATIGRFLAYMVPHTKCEVNSHKRSVRLGNEFGFREGMKKNLIRVEDTLCVLRTGSCVSCYMNSNGLLGISGVKANPDADLVPEL